ncbi:MAG: hypothetical protein ACJ8EJ_09505, partial [Xanthobacteraceae bacterium]
MDRIDRPDCARGQSANRRQCLQSEEIANMVRELLISLLHRGERAMTDQRRKSSRQKSFLHGCIYFNNRRSAVDCLIRDISREGAR